MDRDFLLRLARRVRAMMDEARSDIAREQLRIWAEEFEERAARPKPMRKPETAGFARSELVT